jgi:hypothetical protein
MATNQSSSPSDSTQFFTKPLPAPAQTTSLVEQQLRLSSRPNSWPQSKFFFPWPKPCTAN